MIIEQLMKCLNDKRDFSKSKWKENWCQFSRYYRDLRDCIAHNPYKAFHNANTLVLPSRNDLDSAIDDAFHYLKELLEALDEVIIE